MFLSVWKKHYSSIFQTDSFSFLYYRRTIEPNKQSNSMSFIHEQLTDELVALEPDFFSVTFGAGGSTLKIPPLNLSVEAGSPLASLKTANTN